MIRLSYAYGFLRFQNVKLASRHVGASPTIYIQHLLKKNFAFELSRDYPTLSDLEDEERNGKCVVSFM